MSRISLLHCSTALTVFGMMLATPAAFANPEDGVVVGGSATIVNSDKKTDIFQHSDRAVIDWRSFNIGIDEHTQFYQPNSGSIVVNRVNSTDPSKILGTLTANGNVVLINPNGVMFGKGARVDVNGLVATTADIDNNQFMSGGTLHFSKAGNANASVINEGHITAKEAGLVGLVAPNVINNGIIEAKLGRVALASGDTMTLDMRGDGMIQVAVSDDVKSQLVANSGRIEAAGGTIAITAAAGKNIVNSLIDIKGELKAPTISQRNGKIIIGSATANHGTVKIAAKMDVSGKGVGAKGGKVQITGKHIELAGNSVIDASGDIGGGEILIGGDYKGSGSLETAQTLTMAHGAVILNNAITNGDGGKTILWSDETTQFHGSIEGRGGALGGNGGFVETSGKKYLTVTGLASLTAAKGAKGTWLLDPDYIEVRGTNPGDGVNTFDRAQIFTMSQGANVVLNANIDVSFEGDGQATDLDHDSSLIITAGRDIRLVGGGGSFNTFGNGSIIFTAGRDITSSNDYDLRAYGTGSITLSAGMNIYLNNSMDLTTNGGNITLGADNDANQTGRIHVGFGTEIRSNGGNITLGGGANPVTGSTYSYGGDAGIQIEGMINASGSGVGGNIILNGTGWQSGSCNSNCYGIRANDAATIITNNSGSITLTAVSGGDSNAGGAHAIESEASISAQNGNITINGTALSNTSHAISIGRGTVQTTGSGNIDYNAQGSISTFNNGNIITSGTGAVNLNSTRSIRFGNDYDITTAGGAVTLISNGDIIYDGNGDITTAGGAITFNADRDAVNGGRIFLGYGVEIRSNGGNITLGGGANPLTGKAQGTGGEAGVYLDNAVVNAAGSSVGGNIVLNGAGFQGGGCYDNCFGVFLTAGASLQTDHSGSISITATGGGDNGSSDTHGIQQRGTLSTVNGDITITGNIISSNANAYGISIGANSDIRTTGTGNVTLISATAGISNGGLQAWGPSWIASGGDLSIITNRIAGNVDNNLTMSAQRDVILRPYSNGISVGFDYNAGSDLSYRTSFIDRITMTSNGTMWIGGYGNVGEANYWNGSGNLTINTVRNFTGGVHFMSGADISSNTTGTITTGTNRAISLTALNDILFNNDLDLTTSGSGIVTLRAGRNILYSGGGDITTSGGTITLNSDRDAVGGGRIYLGSGTEIRSNGGNITLGGGIDPTTGYAQGYAAEAGLWMTGSTVSAAGTSSGGNVILNGAGWQSASCNDSCFGVFLEPSANVLTNNSGAIWINGYGGGLNFENNVHGIQTRGTIQAVNGDITLTGTTKSGGGSAHALSFGGGNIRTTGTGSINLFANTTALANSGSWQVWGATTVTSGNNFFYTGNKLTGNVGTSLALIVANNAVFRPYSAGVTVGVNDAGSRLNLTSAILNRITLGANGTLWIGGYGNVGDAGYVSNAGNLTFGGGHSFASNVHFMSAADIVSANVGTITAGANKNITLSSLNDIYFNHALDFTTSGTGGITLRANRNINFGHNDDNTNLTTAGGNIILNSDRDANGTGYIRLSRWSDFKSNGGNIILGGGVDPTTGYARGDSSHQGVSLGIANLQSGNGNVIVNGQGAASCVTDCHGINMNNTEVRATGTGSVSINGVSGGLNDNSVFGIAMFQSSVFSVNGDINLMGHLNASSNNAYAIDLSGWGELTTTGTGSITLTAINDFSNNRAISGNFNIRSNNNVTMIGDNFDNSHVITTGTSGTLTIRPYTNSVDMNIAGGSGGLYISANQLDYYYTTNRIVFGGASQTGKINAYARNWGGLWSVTFAAKTAVVGNLYSGGGEQHFLKGVYGAGGSVSSNYANINIHSIISDAGDQDFTVASVSGVVTVGSITSSKSITVNADYGTLNLGAINGPGSITLNSQTINYSAGTIGLGTPMNNVSINSRDSFVAPVINASSVFLRVYGNGNKLTTGVINAGSGAVTLVADDMDFNGAITGTGELTLTSNNNSRMICLNYSANGCGSNTLSLTSTELGQIGTGWSKIKVGHTSASNIMYMGDTTWNSPVEFVHNYNMTNKGVLTVTGGNSLRFDGGNAWVDLFGNINTNGGNVDINVGNNYGFNPYGATISTGGGHINFHTSKLTMVTDTSTGVSLGGGSFITNGGNITVYKIENYGDNTGKGMVFNAGTGNLSFNDSVYTSGNVTGNANTISINGRWYETGNVALTAVNGMNLSQEMKAASLSITTTGNASDITLNSHLNTTGAGGISLNAKRNIIGSSDRNATANGTGSILLKAGNNIDMQAMYNLVSNTGGITLQADNSIIYGRASDNGNITTNGGNIVLNSDRDASGAGLIQLEKHATLTSNGGNITLGGGADPLTGYAKGDASRGTGVTVSSAELLAGGGNILINGEGSPAGICNNNCNGTYLGSAEIRTIGNGTITLNGRSGGSSGTYSSSGVQMWSNAVSSVNGNININGSSPSTMANTKAVIYGNGNDTRTTGTGNIYITAVDSPTNGGRLALYSGSVNSNNNLVVTGEQIDGTDTYLTARNDLTIRTATASRAIGVNGDSGGMFVNSTLIGRMSAMRIIFGGAGQTGQITAFARDWSSMLGWDRTLVFNSTAATAIAGNNTFAASSTVFTNGVYGTGGGVSSNGGSITVGSIVSNAGDQNLSIGSVSGYITVGNIVSTKAINVSSYYGTAVFNGTIDGASAFTTTSRNLTFNSAIGSNSALGTVTIVADNALIAPSITAGTIMVRTNYATADITLSAGTKLTATGTGNALTVASGRNFINLSDANVLNAANGRWLVYSKNLADNTRGGLMPNAAALFNTTYGSNAPGTIAAGNRFLFSDAASAAPTITFTADDKTITYGNALGGLSYQVSGTFASGDTLANSFTGTPVLSANQVNAGTYTNGIAIAAGTVSNLLGYNTVFENGDLTINKATLTITAGDQSKVYGTNVNLAGNYTHSALVSGDSILNVDVNSIGNLRNASVASGPYAIVASNATGNGLSNYDIQYVDGSLTVTKADLVITAGNQSKVYGTVANLTGNYTQSGLVTGDVITGVSLNSTGNVANASVAGGPYAIVASAAAGSGLDNYNIQYNDGSLTVTKADLIITAGNQSKVYGTVANLAGNYTHSALVSGDSLSSVSLNSTGNVANASVADGPYAIVASAANGTGLANYNIQYVDGSLTVTKADLVITANNQSKVYGTVANLAGQYTQNGLISGDSISGVSINSTGNVANASVAGGPYAIVASGATGTGLANYNVQYVDGSLTVSKADLTITASNQTKTYGSAFNFTGNEYAYNGLVSGDSISNIGLTSTGANAAANASGVPYAIVASGATGSGLDNYNIHYVDGNLTVNKATLTVKADDAIRNHGVANPAFTATYAGFKNSDTDTVVTGLVLNSNATTASPAGTYQIVGSGASASNYNIVYVNGTLTIKEIVKPPAVAVNLPSTVEFTIASAQIDPLASVQVKATKSSVNTMTETSVSNTTNAVVYQSPNVPSFLKGMSGYIQIDPALYYEYKL